MKRVFCSYSRADAKVTEALVGQLEDMGHRVWLDRKLGGGAEWWAQILGEVGAADVFLLVVSQRSLASEACTSELAYAHALGKPIVPVNVGDARKRLAPAPLPALQWLDFDATDPAAVIKVLRAVNESEGGEPPAEPPPSPPVPGSYLVELNQEITAPGDLSFAEQAALVLKLKAAQKAGRDAEEVSELIARLRNRPGMVAEIRDELDELLATAPQQAAFHEPEAPDPEPRPPEPEAPDEPDTTSSWSAEIKNIDTDGIRMFRHKENGFEAEVVLDAGSHRLVYANDGKEAQLHWDGEQVGTANTSGWYHTAFGSADFHNLKVKDGEKKVLLWLEVKLGRTDDRIRWLNLKACPKGATDSWVGLLDEKFE